ncbi:MAG: c-type cytochrome, partial [Opitutales bacterium]|nr:c-type cytochrome [Opitutales bacterium]
GKTAAPAVHAVLKSGKTDKKHGEQVFFGKGACMACHRVQGKGQNLGPDLSDLGIRAKPDYIVRAILEPSADIIEGYQQAHFKLKDGSEVFGMVQGETAKSIKVYLADGSPRDIPTGNIQKRTILEISGMPPSYAFSLSTQEVADISAWLIDQRTPINKK